MRSSWLVLVALVACAHESKVAEDAHGAVTPADAGASASVSDAGASGLGSLTITNLEPGVFEIAASSATQLKTEASIERKTSAGWEAMTALDLGRGYRLVAECSEDTPCVDVAPGHALVPVPWSGFNCSAQCNGSCRANSFEGPGTFRLTVRSCDGSASFSGPELELPEVLRAHDLERWGLVSDVAKVTVMRLDFPKTEFDAAAAAAPDRLAGFVIRPGSEQALDKATTDAFVALVRENKGFDDQTLDRCKSRDLVGFRIERTPRTTGTAPRSDLGEIAIDFACDKLFGAHGGSGRPRKAIATHFSPSRASFLALVKRALPADAQIAKLK